MKLNELVTVTKLVKAKDTKSAMHKGDIFKYEKQNRINYLFHNGKPMRFLTYLEFAPNIERGNHYHKEKEENMLIISGKLKAKYWLIDNYDESLEIVLEPGDIVNVKPGVAHVYIAKDGASAIEYSPQILNIEDQIKI